MLEESYKNSMDPAEMQRLQEQFQIQDNYLVNLQTENQELAETCAKMQQILQNQQEEKAEDSKLRSKLNKITANKKKLSKNLKTKERELKQLKNDLVAARQTSKGGNSAIKMLNERCDKFQRDLEGKEKVISRLRREVQDKNERISRLELEVQSMKTSPGVIAVDNQQKNLYAQKPKHEVHKEPEESDDYNDQFHDEDGGYKDDDEFKDDDYKEEELQASNAVEDDYGQVDELENKDEEVKGEQKAIISESFVDPLFEKLKLMLQRNGIKYNQMGKIFPEEITIMKLEHKLKSLGLKDAEERLTLCRYIIEPRNAKMIEFNENRSISKENAENVLKSKIENYKTYENDAEVLKQRILQQVGRFISTLKDALECEDLDGTGFIPASVIKS